MRKRLLGVLSVVSLRLSLMVGLPVAEAAERGRPVGSTANSSPRSDKPTYVPGEVLVTFDAEATRQQKRSVRAQAAGSPLTARSSAPERVGLNVELMPLGKGISMTEAITDLEDKPGVVAVEPNYILHTSALPQDPYVTDGSLWGMHGTQTSERRGVAQWRAFLFGDDDEPSDEWVDTAIRIKADRYLATSIWRRSAYTRS